MDRKSDSQPATIRSWHGSVIAESFRSGFAGPKSFGPTLTKFLSLSYTLQRVAVKLDRYTTSN
jgi:hypothetical protein